VSSMTGVYHSKCFQIHRDTGLWYSVEYSSFSVGPEADKYRLNVSGFSGDEGDALAAPVNQLTRVANGMQFSCLGADNDELAVGLCTGGRGGWWFNRCTRSLLNYDTNGGWNSVTDENINDVVFTRMLVKLD